MPQLPLSTISGGFQVPSTAPGIILARIPANAESPAVLTVLNRSTTAVVYLKWIPLEQTGQVFATNDAGIVLDLSRASYTWDNPPRNAMLIALSTVAASIVAVDGSWVLPQVPQLL